MDIFQAAMSLKSNNDVALEHLKVMNKKIAFIVIRKGPRKMV